MNTKWLRMWYFYRWWELILAQEISSKELYKVYILLWWLQNRDNFFQCKACPVAFEKVEHKLLYALKSWNSLRIMFKQLERLEVLALASRPGTIGAGLSLVSSLWSYTFGQKPCMASAQALPIRQCVRSCNYDLMNTMTIHQKSCPTCRWCPLCKI